MQEEIDPIAHTIPDMGNMGDRLRSVWKREGHRFGNNYSELARQVGVERATVSGWFKGNVRNLAGHNLIQLAKALGVNPVWLGTGFGQELPPSVGSIGPQSEPRGYYSHVRQVPILTWEQASMVAQGERPAGQETLAVAGDVGDNAFAIRQQGNSMEPAIADGAMVIIDPDAHCGHGNVIFAKRPGDPVALLRQLWYDGGTPSLRPANPAYPVLDAPSDTYIIGRALFVQKNL
jgi:SOS-response transcriptional repressor LexA